MTVLTKNKEGEFVPAIPTPLYQGFSVKCWGCGSRFWTQAGYKGHYALVHILKLDA